MNIDDQLQDVLKIADSVNHSAHMEESFGFCVELSKDMFSSPCTAVILLDELTEDLIIRTARGLSYTFIKEFRRPMGKDIMAEVLRAQQPILINDITQDSKFYPDLKLENDFHSVILSPISFDQHSVGILYLCSTEKNHYTLTSRTLCGLLGHILGFAIQKERLLTQNRRLSPIDEKAHVLTYSHFRDRLQHEIIRSKEFNFPVSLLLFDIDYYKTYREIHGDKAGEELYRQIVDTIQTKLSDSDLIGRHGLDEIIVCKTHCTAPQSLEIANQILQSVRDKEFEDASHMTLSSGVTTLNLNNNDLVNLLNSARIALLKSQRAGRNQVSIATD